MRRTLPILILSIFMTGCATYAATSGRVVLRDDRASVSLQFSVRDRQAIEDYYHSQKNRKVPPGLAKRDSLPPGLARGAALPTGLQGRSLPGELESRLTVLPGGYARLVIGHDVVIMQNSTRVVQDILPGVIQ